MNTQVDDFDDEDGLFASSDDTQEDAPEEAKTEETVEETEDDDEEINDLFG